jgi:hypothetical protein
MYLLIYEKDIDLSLGWGSVLRRTEKCTKEVSFILAGVWTIAVLLVLWESTKG